jgi:hypothetical protein
MAGKICPPVPPPAMITRTVPPCSFEGEPEGEFFVFVLSAILYFVNYFFITLL